MRERHRNLFLQRAREGFIAGAFVLLAILSCETPTPTRESGTVNDTPSLPLHLGDQTRTLSRTPFHDSNPSTSHSDFYRTIIDNNLFRPLGWTPPPPIKPYRLLGTIRFPTDVNTLPQAILQTTAGNTIRIVALGEKLDADTKVVDIRQKQITLETKGQQQSISLNAELWIQ